MTKTEALERDVENRTPEELAVFREWFIEHDWRASDDELEADVAAGKLDKFAEEVLEEESSARRRTFDHKAGSRFGA